MRVQLSWARKAPARALHVANSGVGFCLREPPPPEALAALQSDLGRQLQAAGPHDGAYVYDLTAGKVLFSERAADDAPAGLGGEALHGHHPARAARARTTASVTSVLRERAHGPRRASGKASIYLRGGGDPTFGSSALHRPPLRRRRAARVSALARQLGADGIRRVTRPGEGDEACSTRSAGSPPAATRRTRSWKGRSARWPSTAAQAGSERGTPRPGRLRRPPAAGGAAGRPASRCAARAGPRRRAAAGRCQLATVSSPTISQLLGLMLPPSDNFFAEMLVKGLGARLAGSGTTSGRGHVVAAHDRLAARASTRGSWTARGSPKPTAPRPTRWATCWWRCTRRPSGRLLREKMAVAGRTGTLELRMRKTAAAGRCIGKTGTLTGVSNLVGYCPSQQRPQARVRDLHRRDRNRRRPHLPGPHRDHARERGAL